MRWAILDKLKEQLEQLKGKIPFLNKRAAETEESEQNEEEESEPREAEAEANMPAWKAKLVQQLPFLAKFMGAAPAAQSRASSEDATDAGIKVPATAGAEEKRKKLIRVVLVLGVLYLAYDTLMTSEEPAVEVATEEMPKPKKKRDRKKPVENATAPTDATATAPTEGAAPADATATAPAEGAAPTDATATAPAEGAAPSEATAATTDGTTPVASDPALATTPQGSTTIDPSLGNPETEASAPVEGVAGTKAADDEAKADAALNATDLGIPPSDPFTTAVPGEAPGEGEGATGDQVTEGQKPTGPEGDMTEQILQDLEKQVAADKDGLPAGGSYVAPPSYDNPGRGLVYNCQGKHWACVDGGSYRVCQQNYAALKGQAKPKECYSDSVYQSDTACSWVQRQKITGNSKTDFCL